MLIRATGANAERRPVASPLTARDESVWTRPRLTLTPTAFCQRLPFEPATASARRAEKDQWVKLSVRHDFAHLDAFDCHTTRGSRYHRVSRP
jgi:hypothetical protein